MFCLVLAGVLSSVCLSGAPGHAQPPPPSVDQPANADDTLKTCLQRHYEASHDKTAAYSSGGPLIATCRDEWDAARSACAAQPGKTEESCDAQARMMLLGFVPVR